MALGERLTQAAASDLVDQWNVAHGHFLQLSPAHLDWNISGQNWVEYRYHRLVDFSFVTAEATEQGILAGIDPHLFWVTLWVGKNPDLSIVLAEQVLSLARFKGKRAVLIGGDEFHFLPGSPIDDDWTEKFQTHFLPPGRQPVVVGDLVGELDSEPIDQYFMEHFTQAKKLGLTLRLVQQKGDESVFHSRLKTEFPGRWEREFLFWRNRSDASRATWFEFLDGEGRSKGFSRIAVRGAKMHWGEGWVPGALRLPLSSEGSFAESDGCLGPIGMWKESRGQGLGGSLLALTLDQLRLRHVDKVCIDWTNAFKYYEPLGFQQVRSYLSLKLEV